jgi:nucleoside-diphosphate-sugar epimerase
MKILVTGAGGFIGRRLTSRLKLCGHDIFGLSLKSLPEGPSAYKEFYQQDISRPFALKTHFDLVIHLAAYNITNVGDKDSGLYTSVNADGTRHLCLLWILKEPMSKAN